MLELTSHPSSIAAIEPYVSSVANHYHIKEEVYGNMLISLTEAVNNAIIHGNRNDDRKRVTVQLRQQEGRIAFRVSDEGSGFNPDALPDPTAPENLLKIGGRGIFLMRQLTDEVAFFNEGRTVEMRFSIR